MQRSDTLSIEHVAEKIAHFKPLSTEEEEMIKNMDKRTRRMLRALVDEKRSPAERFKSVVVEYPY